MGGKRKIIDLSLPLQNAAMEPNPQQIRYISHAELGRERAKAYGIDPDSFPEGMHCAIETVTLSTHSGTHLDAPYHFGPRAEGRPALHIDEVPLEWLYGDGVVLDLSHKRPGESIGVSDIKEALDRIGYRLKPWDIVLIRTDADKHFNRVDFFNCHPGMSREATEWLLDQGVKVMGIDAWGFDRPIPLMVEDKKAGRDEAFFPSHYLGREREYLHAEKLANLDKLPPFGFKVAMFPVKVEGASGSWVRAVAIIEED